MTGEDVLLPLGGASAKLPPFYIWAIAGTHATLSFCGGRYRRRLPHTKACRCAFQHADACAIARSTAAQVSKRRPFRASDFRAFHQGSIRSRHAA
jgi:hypothetical protein